jgi:biopolymer transport protein ExbD
MKTSHRPSAEISASSMADIAFLLLTFFLVTTIIPNDRGIALLLPEPSNLVAPMHERNIFKVQINSNDRYLINGEERESLYGLREEIKKFILNESKDKLMSEKPEKAVVSLKTDRGTSYEVYISALDEIQAAYYELYSARVKLTSAQFRALDLNVPAQRKLYDQGREGMPMNISIAEPSKSLATQ